MHLTAKCTEVKVNNSHHVTEAPTSHEETRFIAMSNYTRRMGVLSARIFGDVARNTTSKSMKVVKMYAAKPMEMRSEVVDYYPKYHTINPLMSKLRYLGLYRDEHQDFKDEMKRLRELRGKGKPKKGEGKRATKRNK